MELIPEPPEVLRRGKHVGLTAKQRDREVLDAFDVQDRRLLLAVACKILLDAKIVRLEILADDALFEVVDAPEGRPGGEVAVEGLQRRLAKLPWIPVGKILQAKLALADHLEKARGDLTINLWVRQELGSDFVHELDDVFVDRHVLGGLRPAVMQLRHRRKQDHKVDPATEPLLVLN